MLGVGSVSQTVCPALITPGPSVVLPPALWTLTPTIPQGLRVSATRAGFSLSSKPTDPVISSHPFLDVLQGHHGVRVQSLTCSPHPTPRRLCEVSLPFLNWSFKSQLSLPQHPITSLQLHRECVPKLRCSPSHGPHPVKVSIPAVLAPVARVPLASLSPTSLASRTSSTAAGAPRSASHPVTSHPPCISLSR